MSDMLVACGWVISGDIGSIGHYSYDGASWGGEALGRPLFLLWLIVGGFLQVDGMISNEAAYEKPPTIYMMPTYTSIETAVQRVECLCYHGEIVRWAMSDERQSFLWRQPVR